jgi:protease-4
MPLMPAPFCRTLLLAAVLILLPLGGPTPAETALEAMTAPDTAAEVEAAAPAGSVGWLELSGPLREGPLPFAWVEEDSAADSLRGVLDRIAHVRDSADHAGLVLFLDQPDLTLTQCTAIASALEELRATGKTVMTFAEVYDLRTYLIACAADMILLQHKGSVELSGLAVEEMYLAGMLDKIGVKPDLLQVGKYKGADESFMRSAPSEAWDENFDGLLDGLYEASLDQITDSRGLTRGEVESLMEDSWTLRDTELVQRRAVDQLVDRNLLGATEVSFGDEFEWDTQLGANETDIDTDNPFALFSMLFQAPQVQTQRPTLAVIYNAGPIYSGESSTDDGLFAEQSIGSATVVAALEEALLDDNIRGVVLYLDSPGGSALASEVIWQSVREVGQTKPVYAVVGGMAASGGYYIVCAADKIFVQPHSILGSIGVVGGKITMGGLYDWAGINVVRRSRGPGGDLFNSVEPFTDDQRAEVREALQMIYDQFVERVKIGRGDRLPDVGAVAEGRLFAGQATIDNGMADAMGDLGDAIDALAQTCDLADGEYDVINLPAPMSLGDYLDSLFGVSAPAPATKLPGSSAAYLDTARQLLGPVAWRSVSRSLGGLMQLRHERALLLMPSAIVVR